MTLIHRHVAKESKETTSSNDSAFHRVGRTYAQVASIPVLSIRIPEPVATHNSYSALNVVDSDEDSEKYTWKSHESTTDTAESDDNSDDYSDMPPLIDESNESNEYNDMPPLIDESNDGGDEKSESESESESDSDQEIIVNRKRYQRVRTPCKNIPYPITWSFTVWAVAIFLQFIFQLCAIGKCSPASLLDCSRRL